MGGLATDRLRRMTGSLVIARRSVIITGFLGAFVFLVPAVLIHDLRIAAIGSGGSHGQLGSPVHRMDCTVTLRRGTGNALAARQSRLRRADWAVPSQARRIAKPPQVANLPKQSSIAATKSAGDKITSGTFIES